MSSEVAFVHAPEIGGEEGGFVATGAGADFNDRGTVVKRIARNEQWLERLVELGQSRLESGDLGLRFRGEIGVVAAGHLTGFFQLALGLTQFAGEPDHVLESLMFLAEGGEEFRVADRARIEEFLLHHGGAGDGVVEAIAQAHEERSDGAGMSDRGNDISPMKQTTWRSELKRGRGVHYRAGSGSRVAYGV